MGQNSNNQYKQLTPILIGFALLSFITAFVLSFDSGSDIKKHLPANGGLVGPIKVAKANTVYLVDVRQRTNLNVWSSVTAELLDENKNYLYSFGDEMWHESGYDSEGSWTESKNSFDVKLTIKKAGTYFFKFDGENNGQRHIIDEGVEEIKGVSGISVSIQKKLGSSLGFVTMGVILLIVGLITNSIVKKLT